METAPPGEAAVGSPQATEEGRFRLDSPRPDFLVIGAMKSATSTLHAQLSKQDVIFMTQLKEPNFFSDDAVFAKGCRWYQQHFRGAAETELRGESSTHYSKLPTFPRTVERIKRALPAVRLLYILRNPIDRLLSHYLHDRIRNTITGNIDEAIARHHELIDYGRYSMQLEPYLEAFGASNLLLVSFDRLVETPQEEFDRIGRFLQVPGRLRWDFTLRPQNVTSEQLRTSRLRDVLLTLPGLTQIRRRCLPPRWNERLKALWRVQHERPVPSQSSLERLRSVFDEDLARLGQWTGTDLTCERFRQVCLERPLDWTAEARRAFPPR